MAVATGNGWDDSSLSLKDVQDRVGSTTVFFKSMTTVAESDQNQHIQDLLNDKYFYSS